MSRRLPFGFLYRLNRQFQLDQPTKAAHDCGMSQNAIVIGPLAMRQQSNGDVLVTHVGKAGKVTLVIPAAQLQRWLMRKLRDEAFQ